MADRTITTDLIGRDRSLSKTLDKAGDSAVKNASKMSLFGKQGEKLGKAMSSWSGGFTKWTGKIGLSAFALVHAAGAAQQMVSAGIALSGTLGLLPGIAATGGVAMGTLALATHNFSAALTDTNPKKLEKDLKSLAPAARDTVKEITKIRPGLKALQQGVQQNFFKGIAADIKPLSQRYLPLLTHSLANIGASMGGAVRGVLDFGKSSRAVGLVNNILSDTGDTIANVVGALKPLASAFLNIIAASTIKLPGLSSGITGVAEKFSAFIEKVTAGGQGGAFSKWIDTGLQSVKSLGSALGSVGRIIGAVFSAASGTGGSGLAVLASTLGKIADLVNTPAFQGGLKKVFDGIGKASDAIGAALPAVSDALVALAPALASLVGSAGVSFGAFLKTAAAAAKVLAPVLMAVASGVAVLAPYLGPVAAGLYIAAKAQLALNLAMDANPIGLIIIGVALLAAGIVILMRKSETFRTVMVVAFKVVAGFILSSISAILGAYGQFFAVLGHLPGKAGAAFRSASNAAKGAKKEVDKLNHSIQSIPNKTVHIRVNTEYAVYGSSGGHYVGSTFVPNKPRAKGGPVTKGQPYIVGEKRAEVFIPSENGTILPEVPSPSSHQAWGGGDGGGDTFIFNISGAVGNHAQLREVIVDAFVKSPAGARKLPRTAMA